MIPIADILAGIRAGQVLIDFLVHSAELARQNGTLTPEQLVQIKAEAGIGDADWDAAVAAARGRIAARAAA